MHGLAVACLLVLLPLAGCTGPGSPEGTLELQVKAFWEGDADTLLATYSEEGYWDLGGCRFIPRSEMEQNYREALDGYRDEMAGYSTYRDLVDFDAIKTTPSGEDDFSMKCNARTGVRVDDTTVYVPAKEGSPLHDGWGGVYREIGGKWIMIAGD